MHAPPADGVFRHSPSDPARLPNAKGGAARTWTAEYSPNDEYAARGLIPLILAPAAGGNRSFCFPGEGRDPFAALSRSAINHAASFEPLEAA